MGFEVNFLQSTEDTIGLATLVLKLAGGEPKVCSADPLQQPELQDGGAGSLQEARHDSQETKGR